MTVKLCPDEVIAAVARKQGKEISREEAESIVDQLNAWIKITKAQLAKIQSAKCMSRHLN